MWWWGGGGDNNSKDDDNDVDDLNNKKEDLKVVDTAVFLSLITLKKGTSKRCAMTIKQ